MAIVLEFLQNIVMGIAPVARLAQRWHSTGVNADSEMVGQVFDLYTQRSTIAGKDILEIGPGHTVEILERAKVEGANSCTAVDVVDYRSSDQTSRAKIAFVHYDGKTIPLDAASMDLIWSHTVFEHLRYPRITVGECVRVLRPGGQLVAHIDLGDHTYYGKGQPRPEQLFDCLRYPVWIWNLMRWNRSSYVNRLRRSEWIRLFSEAGLVVRHQESHVNNDIASALPSLPYLHSYSFDDAVTSVLTVWLEKPTDGTFART
jgi:SAM-dependent methyltransferase